MTHAIVQMYHPDLKATGECTPESFRTLYQFRGWELLGASEAYASTQLGVSIRSLEDLSQDQLFQVAVAAGDDPARNAPKAKLIKSIKDRVPGGDGPAIVAVVGDDDIVDHETGEILTPAQSAERAAASTPSGGKSVKNS